MDSLKYVDFLIYGDGKALGTGESYCVLPSHLSLVRGLKLWYNHIETATRKSHLSLVRGLKRHMNENCAYAVIAPLVGARIETVAVQEKAVYTLSHLSLVRGLKPEVVTDEENEWRSHLSQVRGLKPEVVADEENEWRSHLSQVRGLKRLRLYGPVGEVKSHPTRVRGLKCKKKC